MPLKRKFNENGSNGSTEDGNTKHPPKKEKRISSSKNWCFTLKYEDGSNGSDISAILDPVCTKYAFQLEKGEGQAGYLHWQGYVEFGTKLRPIEKGILPKHTHWEKCRKIEAAKQYCLKDDTAVEPPQRFMKGIKKKRELQKVTHAMLLKWQKSLALEFEGFPAMLDRTVHWFWEAEGGVGKTVLTKYFVDQKDAIVLGGKAADCKYGIQQYVETNDEGPPIIIFDVPRCMMDYVSYQVIEEVKNAMFFSGKFKGGMVRYNTPHVIVFANEPPEMNKLSLDRWNVVDLHAYIEKNED